MPEGNPDPTQPARLMDGTAVAAHLDQQTAARAAAVAVLIGRRPCLATVLVGDDPASATYMDEALTPPTTEEAMPNFVQVFADKIPKTHGAPPRETVIVDAAE